MQKDFAQEYVRKDRKHLKLKGVKIKGENFLRIENPQQLAGFIGYLKFKHGKIGKIFFRGEKKYYSSTPPSLYHGDISDEMIKHRTRAYNELVKSIPVLFKGYRFRRENVEPLLQHYGVRSNWIDLVDNIYIAIWFALFRNGEENGYIKIFFKNTRKKNLKVSELREQHSSLSLRPHCQHGISATKRVRNWNKNNIDFNNYLVSLVEIPNNTLFSNSGKMFTKDFMFPCKQLDNTLKELSKEKFSDKLNEIEEKYNLNYNELGRIT